MARVPCNSEHEWELVMSNWWSRMTQSLVSAGALNARQPLVAWEASWDEAEALMASGQLWNGASDRAKDVADRNTQQDTPQGGHQPVEQLTKSA